MSDLKIEISYKNHMPQIVIGRYRVELIQNYSRWTYKVGRNYYFKIDKVKQKIDKDSYPNHTKIELDRWLDNKDTIWGKFLCPPIIYGKDIRDMTWVLQPTCKQKCKGRKRNKDWEVIADAAKAIGITDIAHYDYEKHETYQQWGYYQGKPVIFDFGL
jgi:hypothetical protein